MVKYNRKKYLRYKLKQELLNRKQVTLILDKNIAEALQKNLKGHRREIYEYRLKCHFLEQTKLYKLDDCNNIQLNECIPNVNILITELQKELENMNVSMQTLEKRIKTFFSQRNHKEYDIESPQPRLINNTIPTLNKNQNIPKRKRNKISSEVLDLAISLYKNLNSWQKVCNELMKQGYFSRNNTPYTASSLSRAVSKYKSTFNT